MIDAKVPALPSNDDDVEASTPGAVDEAAPKNFARHWYNFFDEIRTFLQGMQDSPKQVAQADLAKLTAKLGRANTGLQIWITAPYEHLLRWGGTAWDFDPSDSGSRYYVTGFAAAPKATGWSLADGSTVSYLKSDGTLGSQALATTANTWFRL